MTQHPGIKDSRHLLQPTKAQGVMLQLKWFRNVSETPSHPGNYSIICQYRCMSIYFTFVSQSPNMSMSDHWEFTDSPTKNLPNDALLTLHVTLLCFIKHPSHRVIPIGQEAATDHQAMQKMHLWPYLLKLILLPWCLDALMPCTVCTNLYTSCVLFVSPLCEIFMSPTFFGRQGTRVTSPRQPVTSPLKAEESTCMVPRLSRDFHGSQIFCRSALAPSPQVSNY